MKKVRAVMDLPDSILALLKVDKDQLGPFIKRSLAAELYRESRALPWQSCGAGRGAKSKWEILLPLSVRGVPLNYTANDAEKGSLNAGSCAGKMISVSKSTLEM